MSRRTCPWCRDPRADEKASGVPESLCRGHLAEYDGLSEAELDRMEAEQAAEYRDCYA